MKRPPLRRAPAMLAMILSATAAARGLAGDLEGAQLVDALRNGGYVILMRHASSPREPPAPSQAEPDNPTHERQLDEVGRAAARAFGAALRSLHIPLGAVWCSPTYRARETVRLAALPDPHVADELGDAGHSMAADPSGTRGAWLRQQVARIPPAGTNTLLVTHLPNIAEAFPAEGRQLGDGEALILHPDGHGGVQTVARVPMDEWPRLASHARAALGPKPSAIRIVQRAQTHGGWAHLAEDIDREPLAFSSERRRHVARRETATDPMPVCA